MRLVLIADTHGQHRNLAVPEGDALIFAGDITMDGEARILNDFSHWLNSLPHRFKFWTFGNHDWTCDPRNRRYIKGFEDIITQGTRLNGDGVRNDGVLFWGSPMAPRFHGWGFGLESYESFRYWKQIPSDVNVLITHGPPFGILDDNQEGEHCGCPQLRERLKSISPAVHVFGHIHTRYGQQIVEETLYVNASVLNDEYALVNKPVVVDI